MAEVDKTLNEAPAGIEDDMHKGFKKALLSMSKSKPWDKFLLLKAYL